MSLSRIAPVLALLAVTAAAQLAVPYTEDFNSPLGPEWTLQSSNSFGRIILSQNGSTSPLSGGNALVMDSNTDTNYVTNEAIISVDFLTSGGGILKYYFKETADEADVEDGTFLSDGLTTIQIADHTTLGSSWTEVTVDIGMEAANAGMALTNNMQLIFSQRDNYGVPTDGAFFDDVRITLPPIPDTGQPNGALASLDVNNGLNVNSYPASIGVNGPFFANGSTMSFQVDGQPNQSYILLFGNLLRNALVVPPLGSLDIDLNGIVVLINGLEPGFLNSLAILDASGSSSLVFGTGALPPGLLGTFQAAVYNTGPSVVEFTAAFEFTVN